MSQDISESDFLKLCSNYPELRRIGSDFLGPKIWILFNALRNGSVSTTSISRRPCPSLMENKVTLSTIKTILSSLDDNGILRLTNKKDFDYVLPDDVAYTLQQMSYDLTQKISTNDGTYVRQLIQQCGFSSTYLTTTVDDNLTSDDNNRRTSQFKDLLADVAFAGLQMLLKLMNKTNENMN